MDLPIAHSEGVMHRFSVRNALFFSILLHAVVVALLNFMKSANDQATSTRPIAVEIVEAPAAKDLSKEPKNKKAKTLVDQNKLNKDLDFKAQYLSSHNQKVIRETVAKNHGAFQNSKGQGMGDGHRSGGQQTPNTLTQSMPVSGRLLTKEKLFGSLKEELFRRHNESPLADTKLQNGKAPRGTGPSGSRTRDYLPGKEAGLETLLSTREFVYFTYYNRIRDRLGQYWEPQIKKKLLELMRKGRRMASTEDRITKVQIILDGDGALQKVQVVSASGIQDLDSVAVEAFRAAAPFPNPPKGIIEPDGTVKIQWDFVIET